MHKSQKAHILALVSALVLFLGNALGEWLYLYDRVPGYDIPMHIIGGFTVAVGILGALGRRPWAVVAGVVALSLVWEVIEGVNGTSGNLFGTVGYIWDTSKDTVNALVGATAAIFAVLPKRDLMKERVVAKG